MKMEEKSSSLSKNDEVNLEITEKWMLGGTHTHWWWAIASAAQLGWGIRACKKGYVGNGNLMPLKAFSVASLFVGAAATAVVGALRASGIHKVEDLKEAGANIRTGLGMPPQNKVE